MAPQPTGPRPERIVCWRLGQGLMQLIALGDGSDPLGVA